MKKVISMFMILFTLILSSCVVIDTYDPIINGVAPVYQRMELGDENTLVSMTDLQMARDHFSRFETLDDIPIIDIPEQPDIVYYSARNEDVYVRVILDNPDSQVILRFTLNGVVYQSFEFEDGSNSELLIVKVNAGDLSGVRELTIDEIKYIENVSNLTKDADFEGDRTITMAVTYEQLIEASVTEEVITSTSYRSVITISDPDNLSAIYENAPVFYLSDGTNIIYTQTLTNGNNIIDYPYLHPSQTYVYAVATTYDLLDGEGAQVRMAVSKAMTSEDIVSIEATEVFQEALNFSLAPNDPNSTGSVTAIELYQGETLIESLSDLSLRSFTGLLSNNTYEIRVTYTYDLNDGNGAQTVTTPLSMTTLAKATPIVEIDVTPTQNSLVFELDIIDVDTVGSVTVIELYQGETLIESLTDLSLRTFSELSSNTEYEIRLKYEYDLNDGNSIQEINLSAVEKVGIIEMEINESIIFSEVFTNEVEGWAFSQNNNYIAVPLEIDNSEDKYEIALYNLDYQEGQAGYYKLFSLDDYDNYIYAMYRVFLESNYLITVSEADSGDGVLHIFNLLLDNDHENFLRVISLDENDNYFLGGDVRVKIKNDTLIIGDYQYDPYNDNAYIGRVYTYNLSLNPEDEDYFRIFSASDEHYNNRFGTSVEMISNYLFVGATDFFSGVESYHGAVYIYDTSKTENESGYETVLTPFDGRNGDIFGGTLKVYDNYIFVSSINWSDFRTKVYIYEFNPENGNIVFSKMLELPEEENKYTYSPINIVDNYLILGTQKNPRSNNDKLSIEKIYYYDLRNIDELSYEEITIEYNEEYNNIYSAQGSGYYDGAFYIFSIYSKQDVFSGKEIREYVVNKFNIIESINFEIINNDYYIDSIYMDGELIEFESGFFEYFEGSVYTIHFIYTDGTKYIYEFTG